MSATNTTPNIGLPSFIGTDKPSWLTDWNGAMSTIDSEVGSLKTDLSGDETRIGNLENSVSSLNTTVGNHTTSITALNTQVANQGGTINTITSLIGNGTPTTTDQTIIGAINELHANQGDLANLVTTNKSSFVAAINEVAGGVTGAIAISDEHFVFPAIVADGVKTLQQLLTDAWSAFLAECATLADGEYIAADYINIPGASCSVIGTSFFHNASTSGEWRFAAVGNYGEFFFGKTNSSGTGNVCKFDAGTATATNLGTTVPTSGQEVKIVAIKYKTI